MRTTTREYSEKIERELERQFYNGTNDGMKGLISDAINALTSIKSTKVINRPSILKALKRAAE